MFEAVTIDTNHVDVGSIADALVYYGRVNLVVGGGSLLNFVEEFGGDNLLRAIDSGLLQLTYERERYVVKTDSDPFTKHVFQAAMLVKTVKGQKITSISEEIEVIFIRKFGASKATKDLAKAIADRVNYRDFKNEVFEVMKQDVINQEFFTHAVSAWLETVVPEYELPENFNIETMGNGKGIIIATGLDFEEINQFYHRRIPPEHSSVTEAYLLANLMDMTKEIIFGADANSDLWVGPGKSAMMRTKVNALARRITKSQTNTQTFHDVEFKGRTFREVIASGEKTPRDLIDFLEHEDTKKFKTWLAGQEPDASLIKEYDRAVFEKIGWTQRLPFRVGKLFVFGGVGIGIDVALGGMGIASAAAMGLSATADALVGASDEFVLPKLDKGWKPNQFVDGPAMEFLIEGSASDNTPKE